MTELNAFYRLSNGIKMPKIGLGTYTLKGAQAYETVLTALKLGIRHIDSAIIYQNEQSVGQAIRDSGVPREAIFITSKVPPHIKNAPGALRMFKKTLKNLGLDYLDLLIINAPGPFHDLDGDYDRENIEVYKLLEELYKQNRVKAIGVSQFKVKDIKNIIDHCDIVPHVQQMSFFIGHTQDDIVTYCQEKGIQIQAFSPLAKGYLLTNPIVLTIAENYQVTASQIALRYILQKSHAVIPKASTETHLRLNTELDFVIHDDDMKTLDAIKDDPRKYDD